MRVNLFLYWNLLHNWDISARTITLNETCSALYGKERQMLEIFRNLLLSEVLSVFQNQLFVIKLFLAIRFTVYILSVLSPNKMGHNLKTARQGMNFNGFYCFILSICR
jgi:hypothetical protein